MLGKTHLAPRLVGVGRGRAPDVHLPALWESERSPERDGVYQSKGGFGNDRYKGKYPSCQVITYHNCLNMLGYNPTLTNIYVGV